MYNEAINPRTLKIKIKIIIKFIFYVTSNLKYETITLWASNTVHNIYNINIYI